MTSNLTTLAARRATNLFGPLSPEIIARLDAVVANPTNETWEDAHSIILRAKGFRTLWQAVIEVDPTFPRTGPRTDAEGNQVSGWAAIPTREVIMAAITEAVAA
jgi:hypothetical protein